ncbi:MAG: BON domain-containing protein [Steroidobacteraceae bacterium]
MKTAIRSAETFNARCHRMISRLGARIANEMFGDRQGRDFIRNRSGPRGNARDMTLAQHLHPCIRRAEIRKFCAHRASLGTYEERIVNISCRELILIGCGIFGATACGVAGLATQASAQDVAAPALKQSASVTISSTQGADRMSDETLRKRVKDALHSDPYFYDEHVTVSVENGAVVLRGIVSSEWDLLDAVRIARKAAAKRRLIDDLSIEDNVNQRGDSR